MQNKGSGLILLFILGAIWGSSFLLMKLGIEPVEGFKTLTHFQVAGLRMLIAALVMLPFAIKALPLLKTKNAPFFLVVGLCGNFIPSYLFTFAGTELSSGFCGILNSFTPIFTVIVGLLAFKNTIHWVQLIGIAVGSFGIFCLVTSGGKLTIDNRPFHIGSILLATLLYGISVNTIRYKLSQVKPLDVTSLGLLCIMPFALISFIYTDTATAISTKPLGYSALGYVFILGSIGTAVSNIYFNRLIKLTSAIFASSVTYLIPIFAMLFGFILNEHVSILQLISMAILLFGVFLVNFHELVLKSIRNKNR